MLSKLLRNCIRRHAEVEHHLNGLTGLQLIEAGGHAAHGRDVAVPLQQRQRVRQRTPRERFSTRAEDLVELSRPGYL